MVSPTTARNTNFSIILKRYKENKVGPVKVQITYENYWSGSTLYIVYMKWFDLHRHNKCQIAANFMGNIENRPHKGGLPLFLSHCVTVIEKFI